MTISLSDLHLEPFWFEYNKKFANRYDPAKELVSYWKENWKAMSPDLVKMLEWEKNALHLHVLDDPQARFGPLFSGTDGEGKPFAYPKIETDFPKEALDHLLKRFNETENLALKARLADVAFEVSKDYSLAPSVIKSYVNTLELYQAEGLGHELADSCERALDLSFRIKNEELITDVSLRLLESAKKLLAKNEPRYALDIIESLAKRGANKLSVVKYEELIVMAEQILKYYSLGDHFDSRFQRFSLELKLLISSVFKKDEVSAEAKKQIFQSFIDEYETFKDQPMIAKKCIEDALEYSSKINGFPLESRHELQALLQHLNKEVPKGFKRMESSVEISVKEMDHIRDDFSKVYKDKTLIEKLKILGSDNRILCDRNKTIENSKKHLANSILGRISQEIYAHPGFVVKRTDGLEDNIELWANKEILMHYSQVFSFYLTPFFQELMGDPEFIPTIEILINENPVISDTRKALFLNAFKAHISKDYISSQHILPFVIEGCIRDLLNAISIQTIHFKNGIGKADGLSRMMLNLEKVPGINLNFTHALKLMLYEDGYNNFRDGVSHSLLEIHEFNETNSLTLIWLTLKLFSIRYKSSDS